MPDPNQQNSSSSEQLPPRIGSRGFTLVELLMVLAIIVALAAISIPVYKNYVDKAKITLAYGTLDTIRKTMELYHVDNQEYPPEPIDFITTGADSATPPRTVFSPLMLQQIANDLTPPIVSYNGSTMTYTLVAKARDNAQTIMTLTPLGITKAP